MRNTIYSVAALIALWAVPVVAQIKIAATLNWARRVELGPLVSGVVKEVLVRPGDQVEADQLLLRLDPRPFQTEILQLKAQLDRVLPELEEAKLELQRAEELYARTVLSNHELNLAKIGHAKLDSEYRRLKARLEQARLNLEYSRLRAPFAGIILARHAEPGQAVVTRMQSPPLIVLADNRQMVARAVVPLDTLLLFQNQQPVRVRVGNQAFEAAIRFLGLEPVSNHAAGYPLEAIFHAGDAVLRAGQPAIIESK